ncbi:MAG: CoA transferase [Pigmentiphaga sp.]|nr:CoA transferase [Pigmentiphaga sp.]
MDTTATRHTGDAPPLSGLTVVDWTHVLAGPVTSYNLAVLGARVIRIESVQGGDIIRMHSPDPALAAMEMGDAFVMQSAGKESLSIDANDSEARAILERLIARADVLVENFRPGKLAALGFDPQRLIRCYPQLIVCSVSGFGQQGEHAERPAYDHVIQAMSGMMDANADEQGNPRRFGSPLIDYATGMQATVAILAALARRSREESRECGEWLDVSLHSTALALLTPAYASHAVSGQARQRSRSTAFSGNPLSGTFATRDGFIAIVCNTRKQSGNFLRALRAAGLPRPQIDQLEEFVESGQVDSVHECLAKFLQQEPSCVWENRLIDVDVPVATVVSPAQAYDLAGGGPYFWPKVRVPGKTGTEVRVPGAGFSSSRTLTPELSAPPRRGEHSETILEELGMSEADIEGLQVRGAIHTADSKWS